MLVRARAGLGPIEGDASLPGGLHQASKPRALIENTAPSHARGGRTRRTLAEEELADWIDKLAMIDGDVRLQRYRIEAEQLVETLAATPERLALVSRFVGAALGTQHAKTKSKALNARQSGTPYDQNRLKLFDVLIEALRKSAPQNNPVADPADERYRNLPFFEAYFSNFIEGTEFELEEAVAIVYEGKEIRGRAGDSHDTSTTAVDRDL